jgi:hypothetical protein
MAELSAKDRIEAVFRFEQPDFTPLYSWLCNDAVIEHFAGEALTLENAARLTPKALSQCMDLVQKSKTGGPFLPERERDEVDSLGYLHHYERWTSWITDYPYPRGDTAAMARVIKEEIEQFRACRKEDIQENIANVDAFQAQLGTGSLVAGRTFIITGPGMNYRDGLENFTYFKVDYPQLLAEWLHARHERWLKMIDQMADATRYPVEIVSGDLAYKNGMLVSPLWLVESGWKRRLTEIVDTFHQKGVMVIYHSDGNLSRILPDLLETRIDGLNPIETAAGMDLAALRLEFGERLLLAGGLPYDVLANGTPQEVQQVTLQCIRQASPGYIAGSSTEEFSNDMPLKNYLAMLETLRSHPK